MFWKVNIKFESKFKNVFQNKTKIYNNFSKFLKNFKNFENFKNYEENLKKN